MSPQARKILALIKSTGHDYRKKYAAMKIKSEQLTAAEIKADFVPGQTCRDNYPGGYPV